MTMRMHAAASPGSMVEPPGLRAKIDSITLRLAHVPPSLHQLLFRLAVSGVFLRAGIQKARSWETTLELFADEYKLPGVPSEIAAVDGHGLRDRLLDAPRPRARKPAGHAAAARHDSDHS